jgi:hypothetical protein
MNITSNAGGSFSGLNEVAFARISHKKNEYETQKPYRVWVLTGYSSWRKNDSV